MKTHAVKLMCYGCDRHCTKKYIGVSEPSTYLIKQANKEACCFPVDGMNNSLQPQWREEIIAAPKKTIIEPPKKERTAKVEIAEDHFFVWNKLPE
jgi:hypothetical protein